MKPVRFLNQHHTASTGAFILAHSPNSPPCDPRSTEASELGHHELDLKLNAWSLSISEQNVPQKTYGCRRSKSTDQKRSFLA